MQALPTLEDVARCAGTAVATAGRALGGMAKWRLHRFSSPRLQRQHPHVVWPRTGSRYICRRRHRVAEALQHHLEHGLSPREATVKAMKEVSGSVITIALIFCAVFVPVAFMGGVTGQLISSLLLPSRWLSSSPQSTRSH
jgi:hypothetical protein